MIGEKEMERERFGQLKSVAIWNYILLAIKTSSKLHVWLPEFISVMDKMKTRYKHLQCRLPSSPTAKLTSQCTCPLILLLAWKMKMGTSHWFLAPANIHE